MASFNHNDVGLKGELFGIPTTVEEADLIVIPVPWEVTTSYKSGTALGPSQVLKVSSQIDHYLSDISTDYLHTKMAMLPISTYWVKKNESLRKKSEAYIEWLENGSPKEQKSIFTNIPSKINEASYKLNQWVYKTSQEILDRGKNVCVLGGEHSVPLGNIDALCDRYDHFGILHIDAHADLRKAYEGFEYSHASIMHHVIQRPQVQKLVQVGIRDYCKEEVNRAKNTHGKVEIIEDSSIKASLFQGNTWDKYCDMIVEKLPQNVYISFDVDGLDPSLCPNTGTPVPGGLSFHEAIYLIKKVVQSKRKIIGFDLCEVGNHDWDANVGARLLYIISRWMMVSQAK